MERRALGVLFLWLAFSSLVVPSSAILITLTRALGGRSGSGSGSISSTCRSSASRLFFACGPQYRFLYYNFGSLYSPINLPESEVLQILSGMPAPRYSCCSAAYQFHSNLCACDPATITYFRDTGLFDPEVTQIPAQYIYGTRCGGPVTTGDQCPNGNPFDVLRG